MLLPPLPSLERDPQYASKDRGEQKSDTHNRELSS